MVEIVFPQVSLERVKAVLLDLDDTLYSYENVHPFALKKCHSLFQEKTGRVMEFVTFDKQYRRHRDDVTRRLQPLASCRSRLLTFQAFFEDLQLPQPYSLALHMEECYWGNLISKINLAPAAESFLKECRLKDIAICLVTDQLARTQIQKIARLNIETYLTALVTSEEVGYEKPDRRLMDLALKKLRVQPADCILIGDSEKDRLSAVLLNIPFHLVKSQGSPEEFQDAE